MAAGFASSSLSVSSLVGTWIRAFFGFLLFFIVLCCSVVLTELSVEVISIVSVVGGIRATPRPSGVIAAVVGTPFGVGGTSDAVGAKVSLVCFGPGELISSPSVTFVCLDFIPPLGEASLPAVLVGFHFNLAVRLVIVALVASVR